MSKNETKQEEKVQLPKDPSSYAYLGDETITMTAQAFMIFWKAIEDALGASIKRTFSSRAEWVSTITGEVLTAAPSVEDVEKGLVRQTTSLNKTFNPQDFSNFTETFEDWVFPNVVNGKLAALEIHAQMIEQGVSRPIEILKAIVADREATQRKQAEQQRPAPKMAVVEDSIEDAVVVGPEPKQAAKKRATKPKSTK